MLYSDVHLHIRLLTHRQTVYSVGLLLCRLLSAAATVHSTQRSPRTPRYHSANMNMLIYATADKADAYMFYRCFFLVFFCFFLLFPSVKNMRQPFSGTAERIFMKLLPNDSGENVVCIAVPKWGLGPPNTKITANTQRTIATDSTPV